MKLGFFFGFGLNTNKEREMKQMGLCYVIFFFVIR